MGGTGIGDHLVRGGAITREQLRAAGEASLRSGRRLEDELLASGTITERQLVDALAAQLDVAYADLGDIRPDPALIALVPKSIALRHRVVPAYVRDGMLHLAMADPLDYVALEEVRAASGRRVVPMIATGNAVDHAIGALYGAEGARRAIRDMQQEEAPGVPDADEPRASELGEREGTAPSIRLVDNIIERSIAEHASDIHIEPQEGSVRVRMRVDGVLHDVLAIPKGLQRSVSSRIKVMGGMDVTERRVPQDGRAIVRMGRREADLRISTLPTVRGEKIVVRVLTRETRLKTAEELGFYGHNLEVYQRLLEGGDGAILLVGPTGSGKSSTLHAMLGSLNTEGVNIVTLEDPVEYDVAGISQVQVSERTGLTFASGLRAVLRQDPDVISVGEIRDFETAEIAMRAAVTGHLVLSTLHTANAVSALDRLVDMGVEPYLIASGLRGVIAQRLVRRVCPHCGGPYRPSADELEPLGIDVDGDTLLRRGAGCPECFHTGYRGRIAVAEALVVTPDVAHAVRRESRRDRLQRAIDESGFRPFMDNARDLVLRGITTTDEIMRVVCATGGMPGAAASRAGRGAWRRIRRQVSGS